MAEFTSQNNHTTGATMHALFVDPNLMLFHLCVVTLFAIGVVGFWGHYLKINPTRFLRKLPPQKLRNSPLFNVKFSKTLILVFFLINFSAAGYFLQLCIYTREHSFAPTYYIFIPAVILAIFFTIFMIHCLDQVIPPARPLKPTRLIGRLATISSGNARPGFSAQARVRDDFGQLHYVQVEPEFGELEFQSQIILIRQRKSHYIAKKIAKSNQLFHQNPH